jgi:chromosome segregation ATPase
MTNLRAELQRRASSASLQYAVLRIESALVIAGTLLLAALWPEPFGAVAWWGWWTWVLLGTGGWVALAYSSYTDPETSAKVMSHLLEERLELAEIQDRKLRSRIESMLPYVRTVETELYRLRSGPNQPALEGIAVQLHEWIAQAALFARYVDTYRRDYRLEKRQKELPSLIETLVARLKYEKNPDIIERLNGEMETLGKGWQSLKDLDAQMRQADAQLGQSLTALARVSGEVHVIAVEHEIARDHIIRVGQEIQRYQGQLTDLVTQVNKLYTHALSKG